MTKYWAVMKCAKWWLDWIFRIKKANRIIIYHSEFSSQIQLQAHKPLWTSPRGPGVNEDTHGYDMYVYTFNKLNSILYKSIYEGLYKMPIILEMTIYNVFSWMITAELPKKLHCNDQSIWNILATMAAICTDYHDNSIWHALITMATMWHALIMTTILSHMHCI